jgi:hypothetical protein
MKKIIHLLLLFSFSITCLAQNITLSGASPSGNSYPYNGTYIPTQYNPPFFSGRDPGTNVYDKNNSNAAVAHYYIFRSNNYWYIANYWNAGGGYNGSNIVYKWNNFSNSIDPPCVADWERFTDPVCPDPFSSTPTTPAAPSGNFETLTITGVCFDPTSCNTSFLVAPRYIQMPTIPTQDITSINPTHKGMMTYDCEQGKLMLHDGNEWIMIQGSKKDVILPENANITFDNGYKISQTADGLNVNKGGVQLLTADANGFNKIGINQSTPSSSVHMGGSTAYAVATTSSNITLNQTHNFVFVTGTVGRTVTLPDPATCPGRLHTISNYSTQNLTISTVTNGFQMGTLSQATSFTANPNSSAKLISNGTKWYFLFL